jgi:hypothetical protein
MGTPLDCKESMVQGSVRLIITTRRYLDHFLQHCVYEQRAQRGQQPEMLLGTGKALVVIPTSVRGREEEQTPCANTARPLAWLLGSWARQYVQGAAVFSGGSGQE